MTARQAGGVLLVAACVLFAIAAFTKSWRSFENGTGGLGLLGVRAVESHETLDASYASMLEWPIWRNSEDIRRMMWAGRVAFASCILAGILAAGTSVRLLIRSTPQYAWAGVLGFVSGVCAGVFVAVVHDDLAAMSSFGGAFYVFWSAVLLSWLGDYLVLKAPQASPVARMPSNQSAVGPRAPHHLTPGLGQHSQPCPACPNCSAPTKFVMEFGRYLCVRCNVYL